MARSNVEPQNIEAQFTHNELFFSITDLRGVIQTGNTVFTRVSGYSKDEIIGRPHNIIRHPDMPKVVFKTLWNFIQNGKVISAYVKNMAKDGSYYWVVATVFPLKDRYLSIRIKPTSELFSIIPDLYKSILKIEKNDSVEASEAHLAKFLKEHGFDSYEAFMKTLLISELVSKQKIATKQNAYSIRRGANDLRSQLTSALLTSVEMQRHYESLILRLEDFGSLNKQLSDKSKFILNLAEEVRILALNASVESNRMKEFGKTLVAVANEMKENSQESAAKIIEISNRISGIIDDLKQVVFEIATTKLQIEMLSFFLEESIKSTSGQMSGTTIKEIQFNLQFLFKTLEANSKSTMKTLGVLIHELSALSVKIRQLETIVRGAELIHINGIIETAKSTRAGGFTAIFNRAIKLIKSAKQELDEFRNLVGKLKDEVSAIHSVDRSLTLSLDKIDMILGQSGQGSLGGQSQDSQKMQVGVV